MLLDNLGILLLFIYGGGLLALYFGWLRIVDAKPRKALSVRTSLIVAYRNERHHLKHLIESIAQQDYPADLLEVVLVNDHSDDQGPEELSALVETCRFQLRLINMPEGISGKKQALLQAAHKATGDILLFTDADCRFDPQWVKSMVSSFQKESLQMVQGPVLLCPENKFPGKLEQIEFISLMMSSAGSIGLGSGILASGANLGVKRESYLKAASSLKTHIPTGDDMFLLEFIKKNYSGAVGFCADQRAIVETPASGSMKAFWNQRKRWSSKSIHYSDLTILASAFLVFITNLMIPVVAFSALLNPVHWSVLFILFTGKTLADLPLMSQGFRFFQLKGSFKWFLLTQVFYPFYVVLTAIFSLTGRYKWKNRSQ